MLSPDMDQPYALFRGLGRPGQGDLAGQEETHRATGALLDRHRHRDVLPADFHGRGHGNAVAAPVRTRDVAEKPPERLTIPLPPGVRPNGEALVVGPDLDATIKVLDNGVARLLVQSPDPEDARGPLRSG